MIKPRRKGTQAKPSQFLRPTTPEQMLPEDHTASANQYFNIDRKKVNEITVYSDEATVADAAARIIGPKVRYVHDMMMWFEYGDDKAWHASKDAGPRAIAGILHPSLDEKGERIHAPIITYKPVDLTTDDKKILWETCLKDISRFEAIEVDGEFEIWDNYMGRRYEHLDITNPFNTNRSLNSITQLTSLRPAVRCKTGDFDQHPEIIVAPRWSYNLDTGEFEKPDSRKLITRTIGHDIDPPQASDFRGSRFQKFLREVIPDDETREWFQRIMGSTLWGRVVEHIILVLLGKGRNGKSVLLEAIKYALGDNAITLARSIMEPGPSKHPTELMDLMGVRLAILSETEQGQKFPSSLLKTLSGGDSIKARAMHKDFVEFEPTHSLLLATNFSPNVDPGETALWSRLTMVPFTEKFVNEADAKEGDRIADPNLAQTLRTEEEVKAILYWLFAGARKYKEHGLGPTPPQVLAATRTAQQESNFCSFFAQECFTADPENGKEVRAQVVFSMWEAFKEKHATLKYLKPSTVRDAFMIADEIGCEYVKNNGGSAPAKFVGISLTANGREFVNSFVGPVPWAQEMQSIFNTTRFGSNQ